MARKRKSTRRRSKQGSAQRTPNKSINPGTTPIFEAFAVGLASDTPAAQRAKALELSRSVFSRPPDVVFLTNAKAKGRRERNVLILPPRGTELDSGTAWEYSRLMSAASGVRYAEPLFVTAGLEPDPRNINKLLAPHERAERAGPRAKSGGGDTNLACSADAIWSLRQVHAPEAWALMPPDDGKQFGEEIVVGHPDTGYRTHPEIWDPQAAKRRVLPDKGFDFLDDDPNPLDEMNGSFPGHGTGTASVIMSARAQAQETTVVGAAPEAQLVPLRVSGSVIHFSFTNVTQAIYHAVDRAAAHVISMSLGGPLYSRALEDAVDHAVKNGVIVLAAAGNVWPWVTYPARLDQVIAVAACNCAERPWSKSASGSAVDITAPGESVWRALSKKNGNQVDYSIERGSGTSFAVATLAGACATWLGFHGRDKLLAQYGAAGLAGVFRNLLTTVAFNKPQGWDTKDYGPGILDMLKLLQAPLPAKPPSPKAAFPARTRNEDAVERIAAYFPDLTTTQVRGVVSRSVLASKRPGAKSLSPDALGPELVFHIATNAKVRERIYQKARGRGAKALGKARNPLEPAAPQASPTLLRAMAD